MAAQIDPDTSRGDAEKAELVARVHELESKVRQLEEDIDLAEQAAQRNLEELLVAYRELEREVEDRAYIESRLRDAMLRAEEANLTKDRFLANMSHEIRTPMAAILGFADLLVEPGSSRAQIEDYVRTIRRNGEHLLSILNDILDLSKLEADRVRIERVDVDLGEILVETVELFRPRAAAKGLELSLRYEGPVPERIRSDPKCLRQILTNLVGNAIKFTSRGTVRVVAGCERVEETEPLLQVSVIDTGIGLAPDEQQRVFDAFAQADSSTTREFGGTGLGLAISRRFANLLGGDLTVESVRGRGSRFTVSVPTGALAGVPMRIEPPDQTDSTPPEPPRGQERGNVLLAEDGADNRRVIAFHLERAGYEVAVAEDGETAVRCAVEAWEAGRAFDVILMDIQMPGLDGYAATARLRERGYAGAIVALTAHAMAGDRERCLAAGCDDYATKPIRREALLETVRRHVAASSSH